MGIYTDQARTNLGPLTTTYIPPTSCSVIVPFCDGCTQGWAGQTCLSNGPADDTACWPPTKTGVSSASPPLYGWGFYSPGVVCPKGHTPACSATADGQANWQIQFRLVPGETALGCCPRWVVFSWVIFEIPRLTDDVNGTADIDAITLMATHA
jgi:hypothetical protein